MNYFLYAMIYILVFLMGVTVFSYLNLVIDSGTTVQDIRPADRRPHDNHDDPLGKWRILLFQQCPLLP
jgi:hypothetical protein